MTLADTAVPGAWAPPRVLVARYLPWAEPVRCPPMATEPRARVTISNRSLAKNGIPYFPVSGEFHYTRVPRAQWRRRLIAMRNGGLNTIASYIFWNHHQPVADVVPAFDGSRDLRAFVELCAELDLDVVLRIGPWCHGEARNGGFPDWVQEAPVRHRTDDPEYLALVRGWFTAIAAQLSGALDPGSNVIGIQIENELYDQPEHIRTLKHMAIELGLVAPLYMATAWGGAQLPEHETLPMFGGYADGFWVEAAAPWDPTFREHFFFSHVWDDPGIGADLRSNDADGRRPLSDEFPPVTCELGGGMATAYHRRPVLDAADIAAIANVKIGNGSAWQGYYMFAGGLNPERGLQESHITGYPNDLPEIDYDFHAPIGSAGNITRTHALLRQQHAFLAAVGGDLVNMRSSLPEALPEGPYDRDVLRWAIRSDGEAGFLFINSRQPHEPLPPSSPVVFEIELADRTIRIPDEPISVPSGVTARFPFGLQVGCLRIEWATANLLTMLSRPGGGRIAVLFAERGIAAALKIDGEVLRMPEGEFFAKEYGRDAVVVLSAELAESTWVLSGELYLSEDELDAGAEGVQTWHQSGSPVRVFDPTALQWAALVPVDDDGVVPQPAVLDVQLRRPSVPPAVSYGTFDGRASAPGLDRVLDEGAHYRLEVPSNYRTQGFALEIEWTGDVGVLVIDGVVLTDRFWDGTPWMISIPENTSELDLFVLPLHPDAGVWLHPSARNSMPSPDAQGPVCVTARPVIQRRHSKLNARRHRG